MIKALLNWLQQSQENAEQPMDIAIATAVLFFEVVRADHDLQQAELDSFKSVLFKHFPDQADNLGELMSEAQSRAEESVDLAQFTRVINQRCDMPEKQQIMLALWQLAYADGVLAPDEEHIIRRIADLLHVPHSLFIQSKLKVTDQRD